MVLHVHSFASQRDIKGITSQNQVQLTQFSFHLQLYGWIMDGRSGARSHQGLRPSWHLSAAPHSCRVRADISRLKHLSQLNHYLKSHSWFKQTHFFLSSCGQRAWPHVLGGAAQLDSRKHIQVCWRPLALGSSQFRCKLGPPCHGSMCLLHSGSSMALALHLLSEG